jgi:hypothetical protein
MTASSSPTATSGADLYAILVWLWEKYGEPWNRSVKTLDVFDRLKREFSPISNREALEQMIGSLKRPHHEVCESKKRYFYLTPTDDVPHVLPVLDFKIDLARIDPPTPEVRLRTLMFCLHKDELCATGFRMESREGSGKHDFFHCQPIKAFVKGEATRVPEWISDRQPTFPLNVADEIHLLMCLVASLYGMAALNGMLRNASLRPRLKRYVDSYRHRLGGAA